tara:strand:+ start:1966 stop:2337 length:372 start_codon:yes stop_codon:yes gene_type:complete
MAYKNKEDQAAASKRYYEANKDKVKSRTLIRNKKQNYKNRKYIAFIKSLSECVDCGEDNTIVLEFDHVRGVKKNNVSDMANQSYSFRTIQKEIDKCEVRCANCHRIVTHERRLAAKKNISNLQ